MSFFVRNFIFCVVLFVLCAVFYPALVTLFSQTFMPYKANGSLIDANKNEVLDASSAVGSALIGQSFSKPYFFTPRISSINYNTYTKEQKQSGDFAGVASGSFNYAPSNEALIKRTQEDLARFLEQNPSVKKEQIPADLLSASGSGLDPHISVQAARIQIPRIAAHSRLSQSELEAIIQANTQKKFLGIFGEEGVNVLLCNLDIAKKMGLLANER